MAPEVLKILAIDDNADNLITLKAVLRDALPAARVLTAASGPAGIALACAEDPDVILLDIIMPEMDGFAVCRALKADEHTADTPVVFLTALRSDRKNRMEALEAGAEGFLAKPLDELELVAQIQVMAKIKAANRAQQSERERLAALVAERTRDLKQQLAERVHAEALERKQAAKLNSIYRAAPAGVGIVINRVIQEANDTLCRMTGYARAELLGRSTRFLYPTDADYDFVGDEKYRQIAQSGSGTVETRWRRKDGAIIDILLSSAALDPADLTRGVAFTALDITERKRAEVALRESEARYRAIFENMAAACCVDEVIFENGQAVDYRILDVNPAFEQITGIPRRQAAGALASAVYGTGQAPFLDIYSRVAATGEPAAFEAHFAPIEKDLYITVGSPGRGRFSTVFSDITERKQAEVALRESERRFRHIADTISDIAYSCSAAAGGSFALDWMTGAAEPITGYTAAEIQAHGCWRFLIVDEDVARFDQHIAGIAPGASASCELRLRRKDGGIVWVNLVTECVPDETQPDRRRLYGGLMNITERKQTEEALRERENLLQKIFDILPIGLWFADQDGRLLRGNPAGVAIWGAEPKVAPAEYGVFKARRLPSGEELAPDDWALAHTIREGVTVVDELLEIDAFDGRKKTILNYTAPILDEAGAVLGALVVNQDVTERVRAETELRRVNHFLDTIIENIPDMIFLKDAAGLRFVRLNRAGERLLGVSHAEILGKNDYDFFPPAEAEFFTQKDRETLQGKVTVDIPQELIQTQTQGQRRLHTKKVPLLDANGEPEYLLGISEDITERVQAENKLRETLAELQRSNADLERFVYIASHDLQEPLRMVASYAQLLDINYRGRLDADADEFIGYLVEGAMRMHQLLLDLLDYSSINPYSSHPQPTDAAVSCEMALNNLAPLIAGNAATITCDPLPTVLADVAQLTQLFQNLIGNAIKFHGAEPPVVHISARAKDDGRSAHIEHRPS